MEKYQNSDMTMFVWLVQQIALLVLLAPLMGLCQVLDTTFQLKVVFKQPSGRSASMVQMSSAAQASLLTGTYCNCG